MLSTRGLNIAIGGRSLCRDLNLELKPGEVWGLLGANGSGKSTLLHTLAGLRPASAGSVTLSSSRLDRLSRRRCAQQLGLLLQDETGGFPATVMETVLQGRHPHLNLWQWEGEEDLALARQALQQVGLTACAERRLDQLSGGERQRLRIATLLVQAPRVWLLDEPTNHLDLHHQIQMLELLVAQARETDGTLMMSLHDLNLAARFCDRLILLFPGAEPKQGRAEELLVPETLSALYSHPIRRLETGAGPVFIPA
nr:ABC transporter ATP-binding protein [Motiliproteus sp. SC1-56]